MAKQPRPRGLDRTIGRATRSLTRLHAAPGEPEEALMNAPQALVATASLLLQESTAPVPARTNFPWFWVIIIGIAVLTLVWYLSTQSTRRGPPTTRT
jgi:hypothetical protein